MISLNRIQRLVAAELYAPLLEEVIANGRPVSLPARMRLSEPRGLPAAAIGLGLQRAIELTYGGAPVVRALLERLLKLQRDDGSFGSTAATAVAIESALRARAGWWLSEMAPKLDAVVGSGLAALAARQQDNGLIGDDIDASILLWQLGDESAFQAAVRFDDLVLAADSIGIQVRRESPALEIAA